MKQTPVHDNYNADLLGIIPPHLASVIEIGCSSGALAQAYKKINPACHYTGIDISEDFLVGAASRCDVVECRDIEKADKGFFDQYARSQCWVFGDVIEHLYDPWRILSAIHGVMEEGGLIAACIPNAQHWSLILKLVTGDFHYQDSGLLDRTHIRWFTKQTIVELFESAGFEILDIKPRVFDEHSRGDFLPFLADLGEMAGRDRESVFAETTPYQYVILCRKKSLIASKDQESIEIKEGREALSPPPVTPIKILPRSGRELYSPPYVGAKYLNGVAHGISRLPVVRKIKPLLSALRSDFCLITATRKNESEFWRFSPLGRSLAKFKDKNLKLHVAFENSCGLPGVYNSVVRDLDDHCICIFVHDDVWLADDFLFEKIRMALTENDIVGVAGNRRRVDFQPAWLFSHRENNKFIWDWPNLSGRIGHGAPGSVETTTYGNIPSRCQLLDGVFLAVRAKNLNRSRVYFDERFDFHFYDLDFCRSAAKAGLRMTTWPLDIIHESEGCFGNVAWEEGYRKYLEKWKK